MMVGDLGDVRRIIDGMPMSTPCESIELTDIEFVVIVDSKGVAQRIPSKTTRMLIFYVEIPLSS